MYTFDLVGFVCNRSLEVGLTSLKLWSDVVLLGNILPLLYDEREDHKPVTTKLYQLPARHSNDIGLKGNLLG